MHTQVLNSLITSMLVVLILTSCEKVDAELTSNEKRLITEIGFDIELMASLKAVGKSFEQLIGITENYESFPSDGLILLTKPSYGRKAFQQIRNTLSNTEYQVYLYDEAFGYGDDKLAIIKSKNQFDYFSIIRTDGINYDLDHPKVLTQYKEWNDKYGLELIGAGHDWIEAKFKEVPSDWMKFAHELYVFCPDIVDQGTGDVESLVAEMKASKILFLWWD